VTKSSVRSRQRLVARSERPAPPSGYLNTIETALDTAAPLSEDVEPAVLLLSRRKRALGKNQHSGLPRLCRGLADG
jgi:hypothetical protein